MKSSFYKIFIPILLGALIILVSLQFVSRVPSVDQDDVDLKKALLVIEKGEDPIVAGLRELEEETGYIGKNPRLIGTARPNAAILSNRCFFVFVEDVVKTKDLNFDLHEELVTELHHTNKLKELVQRGEITHSIGVNAIFHLFLELQSTDSL